MNTPPFIVERHDNLNILRDDLLLGGTKRRALSYLLNRHCERSKAMTDNIYYAGTTMGHGALALAHACKDNNRRAHIFISGTDSDPMIQKLRDKKAILYLQTPMPISDLHALALTHANGDTVFPPGFDMPEFEDTLIQAMADFDVSPYPEIWTTSVTGTLTRALKRAFPDKRFKTVSVVKSGHGDFSAPEKYHQPAKTPPAYTSCPYTDAKLWQFAKPHAAPNALLWNTAG